MVPALILHVAVVAVVAVVVVVVECVAGGARVRDLHFTTSFSAFLAFTSNPPFTQRRSNALLYSLKQWNSCRKLALFSGVLFSGGLKRGETEQGSIWVGWAVGLAESGGGGATIQ